MKETNSNKDKEWFESWFNSPAYHVLYGNRDQTEADHLIEALHKTEVKEGDVILDAGCGAGRHVLSWAKKGYCSSGFDLSPESIALAKQSAAEIGLDGHTTFKVLDLRSLKTERGWMEKFDVVTNLFTSFGYFKTSKEHADVLQGFASCLKVGGKLVFDYINTPYSKSRLVEDEVVSRGNYTFQIHREFTEGGFKKYIRYQDAVGDHQVVVEQVKSWNIEELKMLLSAVGLQVTTNYGDYNLNPYTLYSPRLILIAEKTR